MLEKMNWQYYIHYEDKIMLPSAGMNQIHIVITSSKCMFLVTIHIELLIGKNQRDVK